MPVMTGPDAASETRKLGCNTFIVGITGNVLLEDVEYFKKCGANCVLSKPFVLAELEMMWMEYGIAGRSKNPLLQMMVVVQIHRLYEIVDEMFLVFRTSATLTGTFYLANHHHFL